MSADVAAFLDALELPPEHTRGRTAEPAAPASAPNGPAEPVTVFGQVVGRSSERLYLAVGPSTLEIPLVDVVSIEHAGPPTATVVRGGAAATAPAPSADGRAGAVRLVLRGAASVEIRRRLTVDALGLAMHVLPAIPARPVRPRRLAVAPSSAGRRAGPSGGPSLMTLSRPRPTAVAPAGIPAQYDAVDLGQLPPYASHVYVVAINDLGQVVGYAYEPGFPHREAVLWTEGGTGGPPENPQLRGLGNFAGDDYWHSSEAYGLNNRGQVVGWANGTDILLDPWHAFVWQAGKMTDL